VHYGAFVVDDPKLLLFDCSVSKQSIKGSSVMKIMKSSSRRTARHVLLLLAACLSLAVFASTAAAATSSSQDLCVGLECDVPASGTYVAEAQGSVPEVTGIDQLLAQKSSGFYSLPALVYRGDAQPRAVVYLAKSGDLAQMPTSVRNLPVVQSLLTADSSGIDATTFVVVDHGIRLVLPTDPGAAASRSAGARPHARAATLPFCPSRSFCLYQEENYLGSYYEWPGVLYAGIGWMNLGTNFGKSQINARAGDTLLADHSLGEGTRYCAQQESEDSSFSNNPIGNGNASSVALLGSTPDRC